MNLEEHPDLQRKKKLEIKPVDLGLLWILSFQNQKNF